MSDVAMTCDQFEDHLEDYLDGTLDSATQRRADAHCAGCSVCAVLVSDLSGLVVDAKSLPLPAPSRDLWPDIEARLETPVRVLPLTTSRAPAASTLPWRQLVAAAAVLVTLSAGVTWNVARRAPLDSGTTLASSAMEAERSLPTNTGSSATSDSNTSNSRALDIAPPAIDATNSAVMPPSTIGGAVARDARGSGYVASAPMASLNASPTRVVAASNAGSRVVTLDTLYGREIAMLRTVAETQLGLLDSSTVTVIRRNLDIIDNAIRESRSALAADPNSGFLLDQLDRAYERKVDMLRRLALL